LGGASAAVVSRFLSLSATSGTYLTYKVAHCSIHPTQQIPGRPGDQIRNKKSRRRIGGPNRWVEEQIILTTEQKGKASKRLPCVSCHPTLSPPYSFASICTLLQSGDQHLPHWALSRDWRTLSRNRICRKLMTKGSRDSPSTRTTKWAPLLAQPPSATLELEEVWPGLFKC